MATASWRTCRAHDGMWPPKLRPSRSIGRRDIAFRIFPNMAAVRYFEFINLIFDLMTVIAVITCCCIKNFINIGSRILPPDAHDCIMFNAPWLGNGRCYGNRIMAHNGMWPPKLRPSRSIGRRVMAFKIFSNMAASAILNFILFFILSSDCRSGPNMLQLSAAVYQILSKLVHAFGLQTPITAECSIRRC